MRSRNHPYGSSEKSAQLKDSSDRRVRRSARIVADTDALVAASKQMLGRSREALSRMDAALRVPAKKKR